jgi:hypothetical protein
MARFDFVSPGAMAGDAITQYFADFDKRRRQQEQDALAATKQQEDLRREAAQQVAQQHYYEALTTASQANAAGLQADREARALENRRLHDEQNAAHVSDEAQPGDIADAETQRLMKETGRGGQLVPGVVVAQQSPGTLVDGTTDTIEGATVAPSGEVEMRGGAKYLAARQAADEKAAAAEQAAADREAAAQQQRDFVGTQNDANRQNARAIAEIAHAGSNEAVGVEYDAKTLPWLKDSKGNPVNYVDMSMYVGRDKTKARQEAHASGIVPLSKDDVGLLQDADGALANMDYIESMITSKLPKDATGRVLGGALSNKIEAYLQTDDQLATLPALRAAAIKSLRAAAGSRGFRMTEAEIMLAVENDIPKITDTVSAAKQKLDHMRKIITNASQAVIGQPYDSNAKPGGGAPGAGAGGAGGGKRPTIKSITPIP